MIGMIFMVSFQIFQVVFVYLHQSALAHEHPDSPIEGDLWSNAMFIPYVGPIILTYAALVSIFTANLYTDGYTAHNKTSVFLLNPNATRDELDGVTPELFETRHQPYHMVLHVDDR